MPKINGNIDGIRKSTLDEMAALYDFVIEPDEFVPQELLKAVCGYSALYNREIALYITRDGEIADIIVGWSDHVDMPDLRLRRGNQRLSMIRCIHTHPKASGLLSDVDLSALKTLRFDAICAVGLSEEGSPVTIQSAFLSGDESNGFVITELISAKRIPHEEWLEQIEQSDAAFCEKDEKAIPEKERAVLIGIESESSLEELKELAKTAGAECVLTVLQKRPKADSAYCIGRGKAEETALRAQAADANLIIFDEELSAVTQRNLEEVFHLRVIDRTTLILDIFAMRASTREGKLQVEMAQLRYRAAHLLGQGISMSRLGGGIGTRGPGESKLEVNRRRIRERINQLENELDQVQKQRDLRRKNREKNGIPVVALVGYTNAGKSTLFNRLTDASVYVENQLFATLDSISRPIQLPHGQKILLVDTVGFIRKLPHELVRAFRSTLEEAALADLLLIVCDGLSSENNSHYHTVQEVLESLGADETPQICVLNKCDAEGVQNVQDVDTIPISALNGEGIDLVLSEIEKKIGAGVQEVTMLVPFDKYALLNKLYASGGLISQEHTDSGVVVKCRLSEDAIRFYCKEGIKLLNSCI